MSRKPTRRERKNGWKRHDPPAPKPIDPRPPGEPPKRRALPDEEQEVPDLRTVDPLLLVTSLLTASAIRRRRKETA